MLQRMKELVIAALIAAAASTASADDSQCGVVESVREVPLPSSAGGLADVFEHAINPETAQELVVRLEDESAITVIQDGARRFEPGQTVLVEANPFNSLTERSSP